jgi:hypothetical protein
MHNAIFLSVIMINVDDDCIECLRRRSFAECRGLTGPRQVGNLGTWFARSADLTI